MLNDVGTHRQGDLYGTVEQIVEGGCGATTELDPGAAANEVPDGWLPEGATTVTC